MVLGHDGAVGAVARRVLAAVLLAVPTCAQVWVATEEPTLPWHGVFDARRDRFVRMPTNDARLYEGSAGGWRRMEVGTPPFAAPIGRRDAALALDPRRGIAHLFGGILTGNASIGDHWLWDGVAWTSVSTALSPPRRFGAAMAYDARRDRIVLCGGEDPAQFPSILTDTWEWDGQQWLTGPAGVPAAPAAKMVFDASAGRMLFLGSSTASFDGVAWVIVATQATSQSLALAYDELRQRAVVYQGSSRQILEWTGAAWTAVTTNVPALGSPAAWFDPRRGGVVLADSSSGGSRLVWNGTTLVPVVSAPRVSLGAYCHDPVRGEGVVFGGSSVAGSDATWVWRDHAWQARNPALRPPGRYGAAAAFDSGTGRMLVFGGSAGGAGYLGDLWSWDGTSWTQVSASGGGPASAMLASMAFDSARGRAVLFGGVGSAGPGLQTWEWDGAAWHQVATVAQPRSFLGSMVYDPIRARCVHFAIWNGQPDTWTYDGATWTQLPAGGPTSSGPLLFDPVRGTTVLLQMGQNGYELQGSQWQVRSDVPAYGGDALASAAFDVGRSGYIVFDSRAIRELTTTPPVDDYYGTACGTPASAVLMTDRRPRTGAAGFAFELGAEAGAPALLGLASTSPNQPLGQGCTLWIGTAVDLQFAIADAFGRTRWPIPIPASAALVGAKVFAQAGALAANGAAMLSQGVRIIVGD